MNARDHTAVELIALRDAILDAIDDLHRGQTQAALQRLRAALTSDPPRLRAELTAARLVVKAAERYVRAVATRSELTNEQYERLEAAVSLCRRAQDWIREE